MCVYLFNLQCEIGSRQRIFSVQVYTHLSTAFVQAAVGSMCVSVKHYSSTITNKGEGGWTFSVQVHLRDKTLTPNELNTRLPFNIQALKIEDIGYGQRLRIHCLKKENKKKTGKGEHITTTTIHISLSGQQMAQLILSICDILIFILIILIIMSTTILIIDISLG